MVADPMFRASRPEMTPSSNETLATGGAGGASKEGGRASGPATISRPMVPCGYSKTRSSTGTFASAFSTMKCAVLGAPLRPWLIEVGIQTPATRPYAPGSASVTCSLPRTRRSLTMRISRNASGSRKTYCTSPSFRATRILCAGVPSTSSTPRYSTRLPFSRQEMRWPSMSASWASARASSCEARSGSRRPRNGDSFHPSFPFQACTAVSPCRVTSERKWPGRVCTCAHAISIADPRRPMPEKTARPVRRSVLSFCTFAAPPRAARFFAKSSSRVMARALKETTNDATSSRIRMRPPAEGVAECSNGTVPPTPAVRYSKDITNYQTFIGAEANIALNNTGPAIADIDLIRVQSGGLAASSGLNPSNILDELLKQKRYSLLFEGGHRWIDLRRYGKLDATHVAIDTTDDVIHAAFPIPLTESQTP